MSLTVWDQDGASTSITQSIDIQANPYGNAISNSDFSENSFPSNKVTSVQADLGWLKVNASTYDPLLGQNGDGGVVLSNGNLHNQGLSQVILDNGMRRGLHTLEATFKNIESELSSSDVNKITVTLWGIDGQFQVKDRRVGPEQVGILSMNAEELLSVDVGGSSYDWTTFDWQVDLGQGYEYLLADVHILETNKTGDYVAIDDFSLIGRQPL